MLYVFGFSGSGSGFSSSEYINTLPSAAFIRKSCDSSVSHVSTKLTYRIKSENKK